VGFEGVTVSAKVLDKKRLINKCGQCGNVGTQKRISLFPEFGPSATTAASYISV